MEYDNDPKLPAPVCDWVWVGQTDDAWHRCDRKQGHSGLHAENGETYVKGGKV